MVRPLASLKRDTSGAIAPMYVIALFGVLAMAGVGYDYAQLASLDTELQNAADQAALAAATQLTGQTGATGFASTAATTYVSNRTIFASDAASNRALAVDGTTIQFFLTKADAEAGTSTTTSDAARYVKVTMVTRRARYLLTPLVGLFTSPSISASAIAGMNSSVCGVAPVLVCNPSADPSTFNVAPGTGMLLTIGGLGPGKLAFLDAGQVVDQNSAKQSLAAMVALNSQSGNCLSIDAPKVSANQASVSSTANNAIPAVITAFNTRFDIYDKSDPIKCYTDGTCSPSDNARKDVAQVLSKNDTAPTSLSKQDCWAPGNGTGGKGQGWQFTANPYRPTTSAAITTTPDLMGYPRDQVHAYPGGASSYGAVGNGTWDIDAYWRSNKYGPYYANEVTSAANPSKPTRYEVYRWERATGRNSSTGALFNSTSPGPGASTTTNYYARYSGPICKAGITPGGSVVDRRVLSAPIVNCTGVTAGQTITPIAWVDLFLVEPSLDRTGKDASGNTVTFTSQGDIYVEYIKRTDQAAGGSTATQAVRRDKPFLVQ